MSDDASWNATVRLGAWSGRVALPKALFPTAEGAVNTVLRAGLAAVEDANPRPAPLWHDEELCCGIIWAQVERFSNIVKHCPCCGDRLSYIPKEALE